MRITDGIDILYFRITPVTYPIRAAIIAIRAVLQIRITAGTLYRSSAGKHKESE
jgi:hypothetical protein